MIMPGTAEKCMTKLNQIDIYPSSVVQTNTSTHCLVVVPQYAVQFIQEQLVTCSCYFEPPAFATTVQEVKRLGLCYRQINEVYVEIGSPDSEILAHVLRRVIPFVQKKAVREASKTLVAHVFRSWKGFIERCKLLREKQDDIHAMQSQLEEAQMLATRAKCARLFSGSLVGKYRKREMVGRAFAKWILRAQTLSPPQSPRTPPKSPRKKKKKKMSILEKDVGGVQNMRTLRAFLKKYCPGALADLEDTLAMAEATDPIHASVLKESNGTVKKTTKKKSGSRQVLSLLNRIRGKKSLLTVFGEIRRFMSEQYIATLDDLLARLRFNGTVVVKQFKDLNTVPLPKKWTIEMRKAALDYIMFRSMGKIDKICLYEWVLSKHPGLVPDLTDAVGTIAEGFNACVDVVKGTHFDLLCEVKKYLFQTLGREIPHVRRVPNIDALKMVERCLDEDSRAQGRHVIGGISCDAAVFGMLQEIANGFSGRTDEEDKTLLAAICGGKEKAGRLWSALEIMKDVGAAAECPYLDSGDYEGLMMWRKLLDSFIDAEDDIDRYDMLRGLFGVFAMKQSDVRILRETMFQHRQLGERDEGALEAIAVSLNISNPNTSTLYSIFLHLMERFFVKDAAMSLQPPRRGRSKAREGHRDRSCSRTRSPQARSDPAEMKSPPAATKA